MPRFVSIWFPNWPVQRLRHAQPELEDRPLVLFSVAHQGLRVVACSKEAQVAGVRPSLPLAEANLLLETAARQANGSLPVPVASRCLWEPVADEKALRELACGLESFSPTVGLEQAEFPETLLLDVTGCTELFGGEEEFLDQLVRQLMSKRWRARVAVADSVAAAWGLSHFADKQSLRQRRVRPPVELLQFTDSVAVVGRLPVQALRLSDRVLELLRELDLQRIEQLEKLPRSSLAARFGPIVAERLDQIRGDLPEFITPVRPTAFPSAVWEGDFPLREMSALDIILEDLLQQVTGRLKPRGLGVLQLQIRIGRPAEPAPPISVGLVSPSNNVRRLLTLARLQFERCQLPEDIERVTVQVMAADFLSVRQNGLDESLRPETETSVGWGKGLTDLFNRLANRLGSNAVVMPELSRDPQPERAVRHVALTAVSKPSAGVGRRAFGPIDSRPTRLLQQPAEVQATGFRADGSPRQFVWQGDAYRVCHSWGPERIETGWWRQQSPIRRDYYRVATQTGARFWLFRQRDQNNWWLHGLFD